MVVSLLNNSFIQHNLHHKIWCDRRASVTLWVRIVLLELSSYHKNNFLLQKNLLQYFRFSTKKLFVERNLSIGPFLFVVSRGMLMHSKSAAIHTDESISINQISNFVFLSGCIFAMLQTSYSIHHNTCCSSFVRSPYVYKNGLRKC